MTRTNDEGRAALLGLSFAAMGLLKLLGLEARIFRRWGLSNRQLRHVGLAELGGAALVSARETRSIGAAGLAGLSAVMLAAEIRNHEVELVVPRTLLLLVAIGAAIGTSTRPAR